MWRAASFDGLIRPAHAVLDPGGLCGGVLSDGGGHGRCEDGAFVGVLYRCHPNSDVVSGDGRPAMSERLRTRSLGSFRRSVADVASNTPDWRRRSQGGPSVAKPPRILAACNRPVVSRQYHKNPNRRREICGLCVPWCLLRWVVQDRYLVCYDGSC